MLSWLSLNRDRFEPDTEGFTRRALFGYLNDLKTRELKARTIRRRYASLGSYLTWEGQPGLLRGWKLPAPPRGQSHPLPGGVEDVYRMLDRAKQDHHRALIALCGLLGLRVSEARNAAPRHARYNASSGTWELAVYGKGAKERIVPIGSTAADVLLPMIHRGLGGTTDAAAPFVGLSDRGARDYLSRIGLAVTGVPVASHDWRHTAVNTVYARSGNDIRVAQEFAGHASSATTEVYTQVTDEKLRKATDF